MSSATGIEIKTGFFPMAFILFLCTPIIEINGDKTTKPWGSNFFMLEPGEHNIRIYFRYMIIPECGPAQMKVRVEEGEIKHLNYRAPSWWMYARGKMTLS